MSITDPTRADIAPRGKEIYEQKLRKLVETPENIGKIISIDVDSGDYAIEDELLESGDLLLKRRPNARMYGARIGYDAVYGIGGTINRTAPE